MAEILSQSEIDALLAAVSSGNLETDEAHAGKATSDWIAYDLTSQEKIVRGRLAALQGIHERFSRLFRASLSQTLKRNVTVNCTNTDFIRFGEYLSNLLLPTSLNVYNMPNLRGHMVFVVSSKLTYAILDAYYGGSERPFSKIGGRDEFTPIETTIIRKVCSLAMRDMKDAWKLNYPIDLEFMRSEANPHFVGAIHGSETVAVVNFEVEFENMSGSFIVVLQVRALDSIQNFLAVNIVSEVAGDQPAWKQHWLNEIGDIPLDIRVELGSTEKLLKDTHQWKTSDVILLTQDVATSIPVLVEGVPKLRGMLGSVRGNAAISVTELTPTLTRPEGK